MSRSLKELAGTKTEKNLLEAFAGESMARNKYDYYASQAKKDGYVQIRDLFQETARNEMEHAKLWFKFLHNNEVPETATNLKDAAAGEHYEHTVMYPEFAKVAKEEGFAKIAYLFEQVGVIEARHEERYLALAARVAGHKVFNNDQPVAWICANCGYIHIGEEAPKLCPVCAHPQAFFKRHIEAL